LGKKYRNHSSSKERKKRESISYLTTVRRKRGNRKHFLTNLQRGEGGFYSLTHQEKEERDPSILYLILNLEKRRTEEDTTPLSIHVA